MITIEKIQHKGEYRIAVHFPNNQSFTEKVKKIADSLWSMSRGTWHIPYTLKSYQELLEKFPGIRPMAKKVNISTKDENVIIHQNNSFHAKAQSTQRNLTENEIAKILVNIFFKVHRVLGPGLLESVYEAAICYELDKIGMKYKRQAEVPVFYESVKLELGFRADIIVEEKVIVEIKSVETMSTTFPKILLTYLRTTNLKLGLLVNFNVELIKQGIKRIVNNL